MKYFPFVLPALGLVAAVLAPAAPAFAREKLTGEQELAKLLEGRQAGKPTDCISLTSARDSTVIDKTAIVYRDGSTLWVNRPSNASALNSDDILVTKTSLSQLCRLDTVQLHDRSSHMWSGFVGLEQFVPYRKVAAK
ncbi:MAG: hypothetical protein KGM17_13925 [Sphingomonadales bacterium]|nr:hypothetical protein [Sphingomonadales bacterium]